jgi:amidase
MLVRGSLALALVALSIACRGDVRESAPPPTPVEFELNELSVAQLQDGMKSGRYTSRRLVELYLQRIAQIDAEGPRLRSVIETNPDAPAIADALDAERKAKGPRGPLHGIPILIKDNIDTGDKMLTTAGSLALVGGPAPRDAFVVERLRAAGVVILGKTNLSEWANIRSTRSSSGWSARGGQVKNPYVLDRNPCGSSSGTGAAIAASLATVGVGTETDGSVVCPSAVTALVGIKPTIGLVSRAGIIPIAHSQDTAGPMARTVADAAILLGVLAGADPRDPVTRRPRAGEPRAGEPRHGWTAAGLSRFLDPQKGAQSGSPGLKGIRIGVARGFFGFHPGVDRVMEQALQALKDCGAELVDPAEIETAKQFDETEVEVLLYEFKADLNAYLSGLGAQARVHSLEEVIAFNEANQERVMPIFGQERMLQAQAKGPLTEEAYRKALEANHRLARSEGIDAALQKHRLDAIVAPSGGPACLTDHVNGDSHLGGSSSPAAVAGYPSVTVPAGQVCGLPVGISLMGAAWSELALLRIAYAFEQAAQARRPPEFLPTVEV